jgi:hypothetical protein
MYFFLQLMVSCLFWFVGSESYAPIRQINRACGSDLWQAEASCGRRPAAGGERLQLLIPAGIGYPRRRRVGFSSWTTRA